MSPLPYVRGQVVALALLIALAGLYDASLLAVCVGAGAMFWLLAMHVKYLHDVAATTTWVPNHREKLDRVVAFDPLFTVVPATLLAALFLSGRLQPISGVATIHDAASALAPVAAVIWGSSLVDWYLILPRISGQLGPRPCRAAEEEESFPFPKSWREVTRWWYIHRTIGTLAFRLGLIIAAGVLAHSLSDLGFLARLFGWTITLAFGGYALVTIWRGFTLARQVRQAGHVKGIVGQTVTVERRAGERHPWLFWRELPALQFDGRRYVVDIALESIQLAGAKPREEDDIGQLRRFEKEVDSLELADIGALRQGHPKFSGCTGRCSGINWYCIENPHCFDPR
ncbi:MAG TPA: hypothetical protein VK480_05530 [Solirubrobacterales bacterium]|nr:hypothetical protein [Solirubrobacterales bacterium]